MKFIQVAAVFLSVTLGCCYAKREWVLSTAESLPVDHELYSVRDRFDGEYPYNGVEAYTSDGRGPDGQSNTGNKLSVQRKGNHNTAVTLELAGKPSRVYKAVKKVKGDTDEWEDANSGWGPNQKYVGDTWEVYRWGVHLF